MKDAVKQLVDSNINYIKEQYPKDQYSKLLENFEEMLEDAKYEVKKINDYTAPEEIEYRKDRVEYCKAMIEEVKKLMEE